MVDLQRGVEQHGVESNEVVSRRSSTTHSSSVCDQASPHSANVSPHSLSKPPTGSHLSYNHPPPHPEPPPPKHVWHTSTTPASVTSTPLLTQQHPLLIPSANPPLKHISHTSIATQDPTIHETQPHRLPASTPPPPGKAPPHLLTLPPIPGGLKQGWGLGFRV